MIFLVSANHLDFCSETLNVWGRAWTEARACASLRTAWHLSFCRRVIFHRCFPSTHVFWQADRLQSRVTQSASPSADTSGDDSPDTSHPAQALCPQSSPRLFCSSGAPAVLYSKLGYNLHDCGSWDSLREVGNVKHPENDTRKQEVSSPYPWWFSPMLQLMTPGLGGEAAIVPVQL